MTLKTLWNNIKTFFGTVEPIPFPPTKPTAKPSRVPVPVCLIVMDGTDRKSKCDVPLKEAILFIEANSRFTLNVKVLETSVWHTYNTSYDSHGKAVHNVLREEMTAEYRRTLPTDVKQYLFLYKTGFLTPQLGGSTVGLPAGMPFDLSAGPSHPYSTIADDTPQYGPQPYQGFTTQMAQILTHELINALNCWTSIAPYNCTPMVGTQGLPSAQYEASRLHCLTDKDYKILLGQVDG